MKKLVCLLLTAGFMTCLGNVVQGQDIKIGFIRTQKVILDTKAGKDGYSTLEKLVEQHRISMQQKEDEIKKMEEELSNQGKMLSEDARLEKRESLQKAYKDFSRMKEDAKAEVNAREKALLDKIIDQLAKVIEKIGKDQGYTLILDAEGPSVLYSTDTLDISSLVVTEFDKVYQP
ncbi:OmpH family outer membrane protein [bacterium]|nr:OmpH family outer membrane protein [candidate division CSSED10-310 bacterium]